MHLSIGFAAFAALLLASSGVAQEPSAQPWSERGERMVFGLAGVELPRSVGSLAYAGSKEFSHPGEGLDTSIRYESPDGEVFATAYVYYPSLSHVGLAAIATEEAIRVNSAQALEYRGTRTVDAGGVSGGAIRSDFGRYQGGLASSAAFVRAGRWMIKFRVSGPEARKAEVDAAMTGLLGGLRFTSQDRPTVARPLDVKPCTGAFSKSAKLLPDPVASPNEETVADSVVAAIDPSGTPSGADRPAKAPRIGAGWCTTYVMAGAAQVPVLHSTDSATDELGLKSVLFALYSDAGSAIEIVRTTQTRYLLLHHQIGLTTLLGRFDAIPSDAQMGKILAGTGNAGSARARISVKPDTIQVAVPQGPTT